jgi:hypothetical protein
MLTQGANDFLTGTRNVLMAARQVRDALGGDPATRSVAVEQLERAVAQQDSSGLAFREFLFQDAKEANRLAVDESLATVQTELEVGNILVASGTALGEAGPVAFRIKPEVPGPPPSPEGFLDEAIRQFDETVGGLERSLSQSQQGRFGFTAEPSAAASTLPADLDGLIARFRDRSETALTTIVTEAASAVTAVVKEASKLDAQKIGEAIATLGEKLQGLPQVGRLIQIGIRKIVGAINWLIDLVGGELLQKARDRVREVWDRVQNSDQAARPALEQLFRVAEARAEVGQILGLRPLDLQELGSAVPAVAALETQFRDRMTMARTLTVVATTSGIALSFIPAIGPQAFLAAAVLDAVILGAVVILGMDYTDTGTALERVRGVREIARGLRPQGGK